MSMRQPNCLMPPATRLCPLVFFNKFDSYIFKQFLESNPEFTLARLGCTSFAMSGEPVSRLQLVYIVSVVSPLCRVRKKQYNKSYKMKSIFCLSASRAILWRTWQKELQQLQNVPIVPTRLQWGTLRGRTGSPDAVLARRLRQSVASTPSKHQLCGLLFHHTEAF